MRVDDAAGFEERAYGKLGETVKETRTLQLREEHDALLPGAPRSSSASSGQAASTGSGQAHDPEPPKRYTTEYRYDTFGRLLNLTLPDNESITYEYDAGGNLMRFAGDKGSDHTLYLADIHYDKFEQRSYIKYGNGVETHYTYRWTAEGWLRSSRAPTGVLLAGATAA